MFCFCYFIIKIRKLGKLYELIIYISYLIGGVEYLYLREKNINKNSFVIILDFFFERFCRLWCKEESN